MNKPKGCFQCGVCRQIWDGSQLYDDSQSTAHLWTCGNLLCGGVVYRISAAEDRCDLDAVSCEYYGDGCECCDGDTKVSV